MSTLVKSLAALVALRTAVPVLPRALVVSDATTPFKSDRNRVRRRAGAWTPPNSSLHSRAAVTSGTCVVGLWEDMWRNAPLCMNQYKRLFGAHRKAVVNDPDEMRVCEVGVRSR